ncbi:MAG: amidase [Chloroflexi bacterium]|nr:amidase [Chloroflexota bacterium]MCI0862706.1 amidase [Chloroflexota bacterium]MCI0896966.1 amidase [Chloroflexota bacterium]
MNKSELPFLSASELSDLMASKEVSPVEATEAYLERIESLDSKFRAYVTVTADLALEAAKRAEKEIARGDYRGPMHGVPVAVKDQIHTEGILTTGGSPVFNDFVPTVDATVIANLKAAGAVLLGKLNMTEFATTGLSHQFDPPRNPWDLERSTGGSSSGSGAATAAFLCAAALGEDTGGSVRFPASWCGLAGLRPTWGRVSRYGVMPGMRSMDTIGPLGRTVEDCAITLAAIAGHDPKDRLSSHEPVPDYRAALTGGIKGLRVGIVRELLYTGLVEEEVRQAVLAAAAKMSEMGARVEELSIPLAANAGTISGAIRVEAPVTYRELLRDRPKDIAHDNRIAYLVGSIMPASVYYKGLRLRSLLRDQVLAALGGVDLLLSPTSGVAAQLLEPDPVIDGKGKGNRIPWLLTTTFSLANVPALSVPCGFTATGLPIGLQIAGRPFDESTVLRAGHVYEQETGWYSRRPDV